MGGGGSRRSALSMRHARYGKSGGWGWGELERVGGKEGSVERGIEVGKVLYV